MNNSILKPIERTTLDVSEVSAYLGVSNDTIYKLARERKIPHFNIGRRVLFKKDAIDKWIDVQIHGESIE